MDSLYEIVKEAIESAEMWGSVEVELREGYEGRGTRGPCLSFVTPRPEQALWEIAGRVGSKVGDLDDEGPFVREFDQQRILMDGMGTATIVYFPHLRGAP